MTVHYAGVPTLPAPVITNRRQPTTPRVGRALVECLVAALVLSVAALALTAAVQSSATLTDDATLVARAQAAAGAAAERGLLRACDTASHRSSIVGVRIAGDVQDAGVATLQSRVVHITLKPSPFAQRDTQRLALSTARNCS